MIIWFERNRQKMGEPYRPPLHITPHEQGFCFTFDGQNEHVALEEATQRFRDLTLEAPFYVRDRDDPESSCWFKYLEYCLHNRLVPDGRNYERALRFELQ
jgi:hypothetical protein